MEEQDNLYNEAEERADANMDVSEDYGSPSVPEKLNQFTILKDAIHSKDNVKTTYLTTKELGRPQFSVRFYMNCKSISDTFNSNLISNYFKDKIQNITGSGMSNEGFAMKLSVTNKRDVTRKHVSKFTEPQDQEKEGP